MRERLAGRHSPAVIVAVLALVAALAGTAVAGPEATTSVSKKTTKEISKKQAKKYFKKNIGSASVENAETAGSATTADSAETAETAGTASPIAFARVRQDGAVYTSQSQGVSSANVTLEPTAAYCFRGLGFAFKGAVVTPDYSTETADLETASFAIGNPFGDCPGGGVQAEVATADDVHGDEPAGFFITFYN